MRYCNTYELLCRHPLCYHRTETFEGFEIHYVFGLKVSKFGKFAGLLCYSAAGSESFECFDSFLSYFPNLFVRVKVLKLSKVSCFSALILESY